MREQLPLALQLRNDLGFGDFVAGPNQPLLGFMRAQLDGEGESQLFVSGASGSGRSHLLMSQCQAAQARGLRSAYLPLDRRDEGLLPAMLDGLEQFDLVAIDDIDSIAGDAGWETALFDFYNKARSAGVGLVFSALAGPAKLGLQLPDLGSRLAWGLAWRLKALDEDDQCRLATTLAARRGLRLDSGVARYLVQRSERGNRALNTLLERLDGASLAEQRRLTIPFVRRFLQG